MRDKSRRAFTIATLIALTMFAGCNPKELPGIRDLVTQLDEATTADTQKAIEKDEELQQLAQVCKSLALPSDAKLYSLRQAHNPPKSLYYFYKSSEDFDTASSRIHSKLLEEGWTYVDNGSIDQIATYLKGQHRITIQYGSMSERANYGLTCSKR